MTFLDYLDYEIQSPLLSVLAPLFIVSVIFLFFVAYKGNRRFLQLKGWAEKNDLTFVFNKEPWRELFKREKESLKIAGQYKNRHVVIVDLFSNNPIDAAFSIYKSPGTKIYLDGREIFPHKNMPKELLSMKRIVSILDQYIESGAAFIAPRVTVVSRGINFFILSVIVVLILFFFYSIVYYVTPYAVGLYHIYSSNRL